MRRIGADIDGGLAFLGERIAARIGPDHDREARRLGFFREFADLFHHLEGVVRAAIDGEADRRAAEAERVVHRAGDGLVLARGKAVGAVDLENGRNGAGKTVAPASIMPSGAA